MSVRPVLYALVAVALVNCSRAADWSEEQISRLPKGEQAVHLFNGKDFTGWDGFVDKFFFVQDGMIVGKNSDQNAPKSSTYLLTKKAYRNFRLIFESKLATSEMHSGISLWGKVVTKDEGPFTYQGHLVMYPSGYGYYDLFGRNSIFKDTLEVAKNSGKQHDWNRMEILAMGRRIRHVINGRVVADWSDPEPQTCQEGPIGLQLHSNKVAQEVQWRGLILTENPTDQLVTAENRDAGLIVDGKPAESGMSPEGLAKIDEKMRELVAAKQAAGIVTLVARRGRIVHLGAVGKADVASGRDMAKDSVFAIASMTKPITAAALLIARDDGKLQLDDPVSKYIPSFKNSKVRNNEKGKEGTAAAREITIRDCLTHVNGIESDQRNVGTLAETADHFAKIELAFDPGTKWLYGPGLSIAGRVLEVATGKSYEQFLNERIFQPLEMKETTFKLNEASTSRLAKLYQPTSDKKEIEPGHHWLFDNATGDIPNPSGGLFSTASDLVRFYQMVLDGGQLNGKRVLSPSAVREMTSLQTGQLSTTSPGVGWGLGFSLIVDPQGGNSTFSAGSYGHGGAFGTQGYIDPHREMIFVLMVARQNFAAPHAADLRAELQKVAVDAIVD